jgi:hypothetical protein
MLKFLDLDRQIPGFDEISSRKRLTTTEIVLKKQDTEESDIVEKATQLRDKETEQAWKVVWEEFMSAFLGSKLLKDVRLIIL